MKLVTVNCSFIDGKVAYAKRPIDGAISPIGNIANHTIDN